MTTKSSKNRTSSVFTNIQLSFLICTIQNLSCLFSLQVYCAKIQNFINNSFLSTRKAGSTQCEKGGLILLKQTENSLYKKVNNKTQSYKK